jgi:hypothetical protein
VVVGDRLALHDQGGCWIFNLALTGGTLHKQLAKGSGREVPTPCGTADAFYFIASSKGLRYGFAEDKPTWNQNGIGNSYTSPILADGKIICASGDHRTLCMADATNGKFLARTKFKIADCHSPALADGLLLVRTGEGRIVCLDLRAR